MKKNVIVLLITLMVSLTAAELLLRFMKVDELKRKPNAEVTAWVSVPEQEWTEHHPTLGWFHQKNKKAILKKGRELEIEINTNSNGFRGLRNYTPEKPRNTTRILLLGDSFSFGWGVQDNESFAFQMEHRDPKIEVLNMGVPGFGIDQMLLSFKTIGREFNPDIVLIALFPEDLWRATRAFTDAGYAKPYFRLSKGGDLILENVPVPQPYTLHKNQFPEVVELGSLEKIFLKSTLFRVAQKTSLRIARDLGWIDPDTSDEWKLGRSILKELISEIRAAHAEPVLILIPPYGWLQNDKPTSFQRSLDRFSRNEGVHLLDLTPTFVKAVDNANLTDFYIDGDWHWTAQGHQIAADELIRHLETQNLLRTANTR